MRVLSLFSGAGGFDLGLEAGGMEIVAQCEIDDRCRSVLARHWPGVPCWDDVETFDGSVWDGRVDVVAGGSPCQDLSVAGRRAGLDGDRSRLFWHQCRVARESSARWVLWENVAGALHSNEGADFAAVLFGLTGAHFGVPVGGWRNMGFVVGPDRWCVWRVLDARWFGVPQRRRRIFVVAGARGAPRPEVLLEPESLRGGPAPGGAEGQDVASTLGGGSGSRGWAPDTDRMTFVPTHTGTVTANWGKGQGNTQVDEGILIPFDTTQVTSPTNRSNPKPGDPVHTLSGSGHPPAVFFNGMNGLDHQASTAVSPTVKGDAGGATVPQVFDALGVRRLTPRECERLQGWPDDHTRWTVDGHELADSHRYKMIGNGVAAPVAEWIARRMETSEWDAT